MEERHKLLIKEEGRRRYVGVARVDSPKVGTVLRVPVRQMRFADLRVLEVKGATGSSLAEITLERFESTTHFLHLLEHFVYKVQEARKKGLTKFDEVTDAAQLLFEVSVRGCTSEHCEAIAKLTNAVQEHIKE